MVSTPHDNLNQDEVGAIVTSESLSSTALTELFLPHDNLNQDELGEREETQRPRQTLAAEREAQCEESH